MRERARGWIGKFWREWVLPIAVVVVVCGAFRSAVADWNDVPTGSMKPTIVEGDRILVNKLAYDLRVPFTDWRLLEWDQPAAGEIVVCFSPANGDRLVKRVIAGPGDTLAMANGRLIINGKPVVYSELDDSATESLSAAERSAHRFATETLAAHPHAVMAGPRALAPRSFDPLVVPADHYFVMGDNRDASADSRAFGFVSADQIVGRTSRVAFSLDRDHWYLPRWERWLHRLE
jgi:signal peptidase I